MGIVIVLLIAFIVFDLASWRWGTDSTESIDSCEWGRRRHWGEDTVEQLNVCY